jgi:hypothetical protein
MLLDKKEKGVCSIQKPDLFLNASNEPAAGVMQAQLIPDLVRC